MCKKLKIICSKKYIKTINSCVKLFITILLSAIEINCASAAKQIFIKVPVRFWTIFAASCLWASSFGLKISHGVFVPLTPTARQWKQGWGNDLVSSLPCEKNKPGIFWLQYSSIDTSPLSNYILHPFWNTVVKVWVWFARIPIGTYGKNQIVVVSEMGGAQFADFRRLPLHSPQLHPVLILRLQLLRVEHRPPGGGAAAPVVVGPGGAQPLPSLHSR